MRARPSKLKALRGSEAIDIGTTEEGQKHNGTDRIRCPRDASPMVRIVDPKQSHIHLETCPVCQGTFFDAGEFKDWKPRDRARRDQELVCSSPRLNCESAHELHGVGRELPRETGPMSG